MRMAGTQSWQVHQGTELAVDMALYIRDTLALSVTTEPDIPLLDPGVPVYVPDTVDRAAVTREWPDWWADVLATVAEDHTENRREWFETYPSRLESPALRHRPAIRVALRAFEQAAARHFAGLQQQHQGIPRSPDFNIGHLVRAREAELGRRAYPFRLVITELSVDGLFLHRQAPHHALISARLARDIPRRDEALTKIVAELA